MYSRQCDFADSKVLDIGGVKRKPHYTDPKLTVDGKYVDEHP